MEAIVENQEQNPNLKDVNLWEAGGYPDNINFGFMTREYIADLRAEGVTIAETSEQYTEMSKRILQDEIQENEE